MGGNAKPPVGGIHTNPRRGRLRTLSIDPSVIVQWLKAGRMAGAILITERLPDDAIVVGGAYEVETGRLVLALESIEWPEIRKGGRIPAVEPPVWGVEV